MLFSYSATYVHYFGEKYSIKLKMSFTYAFFLFLI